MSTSTTMTFGTGDVHILAIDCGIKYNIIRSLVSAGLVPVALFEALFPSLVLHSPDYRADVMC